LFCSLAILRSNGSLQGGSNFMYCPEMNGCFLDLPFEWHLSLKQVLQCPNPEIEMHRYRLSYVFFIYPVSFSRYFGILNKFIKAANIPRLRGVNILGCNESL